LLNYTWRVKKLVGQVPDRTAGRLRHDRGDQPLRRKRLWDAAQFIKQGFEVLEWAACRRVRAQEPIELTGLIGSRLAVEDGMHKTDLIVAHVSADR